MELKTSILKTFLILLGSLFFFLGLGFLFFEISQFDQLGSQYESSKIVSKLIALSIVWFISFYLFRKVFGKNRRQYANNLANIDANPIRIKNNVVTSIFTIVFSVFFLQMWIWSAVHHALEDNLAEKIWYLIAGFVFFLFILYVTIIKLLNPLVEIGKNGIRHQVLGELPFERIRSITVKGSDFPYQFLIRLVSLYIEVDEETQKNLPKNSIGRRLRGYTVKKGEITLNLNNADASVVYIREVVDCLISNRNSSNCIINHRPSTLWFVLKLFLIIITILILFFMYDLQQGKLMTL